MRSSITCCANSCIARFPVMANFPAAAHERYTGKSPFLERIHPGHCLKNTAVRGTRLNIGLAQAEQEP